MSLLQSLYNFPALYTVSNTITISLPKSIQFQGIIYNPCSEGSGGGVYLKDIISGAFDYVEQNGYLKILIGCVWRNGGHGWGISCLPITFDYLKGH